MANSFTAFVKESGARHSGDVFDSPLSDFEVEHGFNPRDPDDPAVQAHIRTIANSIKEDGYDRNETILVRYRDGRLLLRDGHCRFAATILAVSEGAVVDTLPWRHVAKATDEVDDTYSVLTTQTKLPLSPVGWAMQIRKLLRQGQSEQQIAGRLGKPISFVASMIGLAESDPEVREAVRDEKISTTEALKVVKEHGSKAPAVIKAAVEHARSEDRTRARPRDIAAVTKPRTEPPSLASLVALAVNAWENGTDQNGTMATLRDHPLVVALRRQKKAA